MSTLLIQIKNEIRTRLSMFNQQCNVERFQSFLFKLWGVVIAIAHQSIPSQPVFPGLLEVSSWEEFMVISIQRGDPWGAGLLN